MEELTDYFKELLDQCRSVDIAETEFRRALDDDDELRATYSEWCEEHGTTERRGFKEFCEEYIDNQNSIWDSLNDYDEEH